MKIFIADDESLVRIGLKSSIEWPKYGMEIVGEAADGAEALRQINLLEPDVILLDIKMPVMDGIEVMRKIKEGKNKCKVIILSSFDDIEHVKEAMKLGAVDYLHKPCMGPDSILKVLTDMQQMVGEPAEPGTSPIAASSESSRCILKDVFLRELIEGQALNDLLFSKKCKDNRVKLEGSNFNCIAFSVINYAQVQKRYEQSNKNLLPFSINNIINEVLSDEKGVDFFEYDRNLYIVITSSGTTASEKKILENINPVICLITDSLKQFLNIEIAFGVSDIHKPSGEIKNAFTEAFEALQHRFYLDRQHVIHFRDVKRQGKFKEASQYIDFLIERLKGCAAKQDYYEFDELVEELVNFLKLEACLSGVEVKKLFNGLLFSVSEGKPYLTEMETVNNCETLRQLYEVYKEIIKVKLSGDQEINQQYQNCSYLVKKICAFIEESYSKEITLSLLSEKLNISPNYISRLFKEETGKALFNYINEVRVEKAKKLLELPELKIYEVSYKTGFKSPVHFNIVFNKLIGVSPKQYREALCNYIK